MSTLWTFSHWLLDNWLLIPWGVGVVVAYIYGGKRFAPMVLTFGLAAFAYTKGGKDERKRNKERVATVEKKRENAYDEIENRGTNRDDVLERLRRNDY